MSQKAIPVSANYTFTEDTILNRHDSKKLIGFIKNQILNFRPYATAFIRKLRAIYKSQAYITYSRIIN